jgi:HAD superfamily hydrolase (TIGR01509 family)
MKRFLKTMQHNWSQIQAIIFDMDGTLVDTERLWSKSEKDLLKHHGRQYDHVTHAPFLGLASDELVAGVRQAYDLEHLEQNALVDELHERVKAYLKVETVPCLGAEDLVAAVFANKLSSAIASNSSVDIIEATLQNQTWLNSITTRCSVDHVAKGKPEPDLYLYAAQRIAIAPENCIAIEDSLLGSMGAVAAGMSCFSVPQGNFDLAKYQAVTPFVFDSLVEVRQFLVEKQVLRA